MRDWHPRECLELTCTALTYHDQFCSLTCERRYEARMATRLETIRARLLVRCASPQARDAGTTAATAGPGTPGGSKT